MEELKKSLCNWLEFVSESHSCSQLQPGYEAEEVASEIELQMVCCSRSAAGWGVKRGDGGDGVLDTYLRRRRYGSSPGTKKSPGAIIGRGKLAQAPGKTSLTYNENKPNPKPWSPGIP